MAYKLLIPILIVVIVLLLAHFLINKFIFKFDFSDAFKVDPVLPTNDSVTVNIKGVDGDSLNLSFDPVNSSNTSEVLIVTEDNIDNIKSNFNDFQIKEWELITNLPSPIFRFDIIIFSHLDSPNKSKKASHYLINGKKVFPGDKINLKHNFKVSELSDVLSDTEIKLVYENNLHQNFFDENGNFVSQSTGEVIIKPTILSQFWIILGAWLFVMTFFVLAKEFILSSQSVREIFDLFKDNK